MILFNTSDLLPENNALELASAEAIEGDFVFFDGKHKTVLDDVFDDLINQDNIFFRTKGAWSNIHLLQKILGITGKADVYFSTWAISAEAITAFMYWQKNGQINNLYSVFDRGVRNRKPEIYQQILANFKNKCFCKCHAKCTVIQNEKYSITVMGSANYTGNPRIETGAIIFNKTVANANIKWILEEIYGLK